MTRRSTHAPTTQPARCKCESGLRAPEHRRPGKKAADHGNPFTHAPGCVHSELQHTTKPKKKARLLPRLRFFP